MAWYSVLKAARRMENAGTPVTSESLGEATGLTLQVASAWLGKFVRWGYVVREGKTQGRYKRLQVYRLTRWGERFRPRSK